MRIKYQRTSTLAQHGNRFSTDKNNYDLVLFDEGVSGTLKFKLRIEASKVIELVESGKVSEFVNEVIFTQKLQIQGVGFFYSEYLYQL